jgi:protein-S-isoprenylcysteine O-methyltransferase Ste14
MVFASTLKGLPIYHWEGSGQILRVIALVISIYLFYSGGKHYDGLQFLGFRQIRRGSHQKSLTESGELDMTGILGIIRHPWYTGAIIILWIRDIDTSTFIVNIILTTYLIIGTLLEEKKLVDEFGGSYRQYQKNVSMLLPVKWIMKKLMRDT